jgi:hypothetical protein
LSVDILLDMLLLFGGGERTSHEKMDQKHRGLESREMPLKIERLCVVLVGSRRGLFEKYLERREL